MLKVNKSFYNLSLNKTLKNFFKKFDIFCKTCYYKQAVCYSLRQATVVSVKPAEKSFKIFKKVLKIS